MESIPIIKQALFKMLSVRLTSPLHPLWRQSPCRSRWLPRCQIWSRWGLRGWWASACALASRWGGACLEVPHRPLLRRSWPCPLLRTQSHGCHQLINIFPQCGSALSSLFLFLWWYYTCFWVDELRMRLFSTPLPVGKLHSVFKGWPCVFCISVCPDSNKKKSI